MPHLECTPGLAIVVTQPEDNVVPVVVAAVKLATLRKCHECAVGQADQRGNTVAAVSTLAADKRRWRGSRRVLDMRVSVRARDASVGSV